MLHNLDDKQQMAKKFITLSTSTNECSKFTFESGNDLLYNTSNTLIAQNTPILFNSQIGFMLSAPPFWRLQIDKPTSTPQSVGYGTFVTLCEPSQT